MACSKEAMPMPQRLSSVALTLALVVCVVLAASGCDEAKAGRYQIITQAPAAGLAGGVFLLDTGTGQSWVWEGQAWRATGAGPAQQ